MKDNSIQFLPIQTRVLVPPKDNLFEALDESLTVVREKDILVLSSKVMAIHQGRCVLKGSGDECENKRRIAKREADSSVEYTNPDGHRFHLTLIYDALISSAGIDESNGNDYFVLLPKNPNVLCRDVWQYARKRFGVTDIGVIAVDSHSVPLRYGAMGVSIGFYGVRPLKPYAGKEDLFGRQLRVEKSNVVDSIAAMSTLAMGEGDEQTPLAIVRGLTGIEFTNAPTWDELVFPPEADMYYPLLEKIYSKK